MLLYDEEQSHTKDKLLQEKHDLVRKLDYLDRKFHHRDFSITLEDSSKIEFEKFLAKDILNAVRAELMKKIIEHDKELLKIVEFEKKSKSKKEAKEK